MGALSRSLCSRLILQGSVARVRWSNREIASFSGLDTVPCDSHCTPLEFKNWGFSILLTCRSSGAGNRDREVALTVVGARDSVFC